MGHGDNPDNDFSIVTIVWVPSFLPVYTNLLMHARQHHDESWYLISRVLNPNRKCITVLVSLYIL